VYCIVRLSAVGPARGGTPDIRRTAVRIRATRAAAPARLVCGACRPPRTGWGTGRGCEGQRAYIRKALHTVIIHPAGKGNRKFNPDHLELIWRED